MKVFDKDLAAAGIPKGNDRGEVLDIHGLRMTFNSLMGAAGVPLATRQVLMRHSDPKLTANIYTDIGLFDLDGALASLPGIDQADESAELKAEAEAVQGSKNPGSPLTTALTPDAGACVQFSSIFGRSAGKQHTIVQRHVDNEKPQCCRGYPREHWGLSVTRNGGAEGDRTPDLMTASHALSQLSYSPTGEDAGTSGARREANHSK